MTVQQVWRVSETASPEEALAAFTCQGIEVVTLGQISTHTTSFGLLIFSYLFLLILLILVGEKIMHALHSSGLPAHSHLTDDQIILAL